MSESLKSSSPSVPGAAKKRVKHVKFKSPELVQCRSSHSDIYDNNSEGRDNSPGVSLSTTYDYGPLNYQQFLTVTNLDFYFFCGVEDFKTIFVC